MYEYLIVRSSYLNLELIENDIQHYQSPWLVTNVLFIELPINVLHNL